VCAVYDGQRGSPTRLVVYHPAESLTVIKPELAN